jgi:hypothetical protein
MQGPAPGPLFFLIVFFSFFFFSLPLHLTIPPGPAQFLFRTAQTLPAHFKNLKISVLSQKPVAPKFE